MARPNARSSHRQPTPQGGGIAVVVATLRGRLGCRGRIAGAAARMRAVNSLALTAASRAVGRRGRDGRHALFVGGVRLAIQCIAVGALIAALPSQLRILPQLPWWLERAGLFVGAVWLVNLVNFMDGIDWMTVAELVPVTGAIVLLGLAGTIAPWPSLVAAALLGAIARLCALQQAGRTRVSWRRGQSADRSRARLAPAARSPPTAIWRRRSSFRSTISPMRRSRSSAASAKREPFWQAHRQHFYQRATDNGFTVPADRRPRLAGQSRAGGARGSSPSRYGALPCRWQRWRRRSRSSPGCSLTFARARR